MQLYFGNLIAGFKVKQLKSLELRPFICLNYFIQVYEAANRGCLTRLRYPLLLLQGELL